MPKLLVLFHSRSPDVLALADAAVEGARSVRFAEVDLRRLEAPDPNPHAAAPDAVGRSHRTLAHGDDLATYDGLILVLPGEGDGAAIVTAALEAAGGSLANRVGSVVTAAMGEGRNAVLWAALTPMADRGMILVPAPFADGEAPTAESARRTGKRVAEVISWVTHARSHHHHEPHQHDHHSHHHH